MLSFTDILPLSICELYIRPLEWSQFPGTPNYEFTYEAHIYWTISYSFTE